MDASISRGDIEDALRGQNADYVEVRLDDTSTNRIGYRGRELEEIGRTRSFGGNVRALLRGGWGFVSFNEPSELRKRVEEAVEAAGHVGKETSQFAEVAPGGDTGPLELKNDPRTVPLAGEKKMLDRYKETSLSVGGGASTNITHSDAHKRGRFARSQGSLIPR